jgi:hypothetical protein
VKLTHCRHLGACPGLLSVVDSSLSPLSDFIFLVYPYPGVTAAEFIHSNSSASGICTLIADLSATLRDLHRRSLVNGDMKLENVYIENGRAYLFGFDVGGSEAQDNDFRALAWVALQLFAAQILDWDEKEGYGESIFSLVPDALVDWVRRAIGRDDNQRPIAHTLHSLEGLPFSATESGV